MSATLRKVAISKSKPDDLTIRIKSILYEGTVSEDDWMTTSEIVEATGMSNNKIRESLQSLQKQGKLIAKRVRRLNIAGEYIGVPGYRLAK